MKQNLCVNSPEFSKNSGLSVPLHQKRTVSNKLLRPRVWVSLFFSSKCLPIDDTKLEVLIDVLLAKEDYLLLLIGRNLRILAAHW